MSGQRTQSRDANFATHPTSGRALAAFDRKLLGDIGAAIDDAEYGDQCRPLSSGQVAALAAAKAFIQRTGDS